MELFLNHLLPFLMNLLLPFALLPVLLRMRRLHRALIWNRHLYSLTVLLFGCGIFAYIAHSYVFPYGSVAYASAYSVRVWTLYLGYILALLSFLHFFDAAGNTQRCPAALLQLISLSAALLSAAGLAWFYYVLTELIHSAMRCFGGWKEVFVPIFPNVVLPLGLALLMLWLYKRQRELRFRKLYALTAGLLCCCALSTVWMNLTAPRSIGVPHFLPWLWYFGMLGGYALTPISLLYFAFSAVRDARIKQVLKWVIYLAGTILLWAMIATLTSLLRHL